MQLCVAHGLPKGTWEFRGRLCLGKEAKSTTSHEMGTAASGLVSIDYVAREKLAAIQGDIKGMNTSVCLTGTVGNTKQPKVHHWIETSSEAEIKEGD